jgi:hypothetical protein
MMAPIVGHRPILPPTSIKTAISAMGIPTIRRNIIGAMLASASVRAYLMIE